MLSKWDSYCRVDLGSPSQNFFRAPPARSAGKPMEHSYRYRLRFGTRSGCQNFRASFRGISKTSRRFSIGFLYNDLHRSWFPNPTKGRVGPIPQCRVSNPATVDIVPPSEGEDSAASFQGPTGLNEQQRVQPMRRTKLARVPIVDSDIEQQLVGPRGSGSSRGVWVHI